MTDFQHTPVGLLPLSWTFESLGDLFTVSAGGDWDAKNSSKVRDADHPYPVIANAMRPGAVQGYCSYYTVPGDTLSITGRGDVGHAIYRDQPYVPIVRLLSLIPKRELSSRYFTEYINERVRFSLESTGVPQLTAPQIRPYLVAVPPMEEQLAIEQALQDVDSLISTIENLIAKKQAIKTGMMQQLLTGKSRLPGFKQDWIVGSLGDFMPLQRGFDLPTSQVRPGQYPVLYSNGIARFHDQALVGGPGVITGRSGTIGRVHYVESDYWPHNTTLWVTNFKQTCPKFVFYFLTYVGLERFSSGSGVPTLNRNDAHALEIVIPSAIEEQQAIARVLTDADAEIDRLLARLFKTKSIKQGMMQELLTGKTRLVGEGSTS